MGDTFYRSNFTDKDYHVSRYKSNLNYSGGYPHYEDSTSSEDSSSEASSCDFLSHMQEPWETENRRMPTGRQEQIHDNSEQPDDLPIVQVVDVFLGSPYKDSLDHQKMDEYPLKRNETWDLQGLMRYLDEYRENLKDDEDDDGECSHSSLDEDLQPFSSASQKGSQEYEVLRILSNWTLVESEDITPLPDISLRRREDEHFETISQETSSDDSSVSSEWSTEGDSSSHSQTTSCLSIRSMIRWFRKRVVSSRRRRKRSDPACKDPNLLDPKKPSLLRGKRIQPQ